MSGESENRGVSRVLLKLEASVAAGNYYEAHQMYRTLYFRYMAQKKYDDCLDLIYRGSLSFLNNEQHTSGADLVLLIIDILEKIVKEKNADNQQTYLWVQRLGVLLRKIPSTIVERETIIARAVKWSPLMHKEVAQILWTEDNTELARHHYLLSRDGQSCGQMLVQLSQNKGYVNEIDLFIAQIVFQQLCLKEPKIAIQTFETYTRYHPKIACTEPPFILPLLNFLFFLLKIIENGRTHAFKSLCEHYKPSINRDPAYEKYLQKIGQMFFGIQPPQQGGLMSGMFGDLFNRLFQGFEDDDNEGDSQGQRNNRNQLNLNSQTTELD